MTLSPRQQRIARRFSQLIIEKAKKRMEEEGIAFSKAALMQACFDVYGDRDSFLELKREAERIVREEEERPC